jgi:transcriptional antiterminator NusG
MAEAFVVFVRYEQELLLLRRSKSDEDYPALWDGVFGLGSSPEEYISRVSDCTGLDAEHLNFVRTGHALGIDKGNRLLDITPVLLVSSSKEVTAGGRYTECEWVDPGEIQKYNTVFTDLNIENSEKLFRELYGSVASFLYIVKTAIGSEQRVANEIQARLDGSGSLKDIADEVFCVLHPPSMRGYVMVESSALYHVEKLIGRSGGRDPKARRGLNQTQLKNAKTVLPGEAPLKDILPYLEPKAVTSGIDVGCIVEIVTGAFKGEKARVLSISETKEEVSMELYETDIPMTLNMRGDHVRVIDRVISE